MPGFMVPPSDDPSEAWLEEEVVAAGAVSSASAEDSTEVVVETFVVRVELGASVVTLLSSAVLVGSAVEVLATEVVLGGAVVPGCDSDLLGFGAVVGSGSSSPSSDFVGFAGILVTKEAFDFAFYRVPSRFDVVKETSLDGFSRDKKEGKKELGLNIGNRMP
ncbi:hypothetical protein TWF192_002443 [Orbilia oligospora]|nr:hypothetical protein TWF192_002443 [Orbilia oligospora]